MFLAFHFSLLQFWEPAHTAGREKQGPIHLLYVCFQGDSCMGWKFNVDDLVSFFVCGSGYGTPSLAAHSTTELYVLASYLNPICG